MFEFDLRSSGSGDRALLVTSPTAAFADGEVSTNYDTSVSIGIVSCRPSTVARTSLRKLSLSVFQVQFTRQVPGVSSLNKFHDADTLFFIQ